MKKIDNVINKKFILNNINQVAIFSKYLNISQDDINDCIDYNTLIHSPIRIDPKPSVGFRYNNKGVLKMRDFGGYFWGDCFDAVAYILSTKGTRINIAKGEHFKYVLKHIASEFNMLNGVAHNDDIPTLINVAKKTKKLITFKPRSWDNNDKRIWISKYNNLFTFDYLAKSYVYPVELYWIDGHTQPEPKYYYTRKDPCYAYYLGQDGDNISNIKLYFPNRGSDNRKPKFITNNNSFQGILDIEDKYDKIVLCKSYKDAIALKRMFELFSFTGNHNVLFLAYPSENYILTLEIVEWLLSRLKEDDISNILNFLDFDKTGRKSSYYCYQEFGIPFVFLTNGMFGLTNYGAKDITDFIEVNGKTTAFNLINQFIINNQSNEEFGEGNYYDTDAPF